MRAFYIWQRISAEKSTRKITTSYKINGRYKEQSFGKSYLLAAKQIDGQ